LCRIKNDIQAARDKGCDFLVVQIHWGEEEVPYPSPSDVAKAKEIIDYGADLIIGHHAHVIQSAITYRGRKIYFGLGNFLFPDLNCKANYDGKRYQGTYIKKQRRKNRRSLVLRLNDDFSITEYGTHFDGSKVFPKKVSLSETILDENAYRFYSINRIRLVKIGNFIKNPLSFSFAKLKRFING
jgi:poly-gamma-glutamate synthesis protein (capsule biosynthesis protein)